MTDVAGFQAVLFPFFGFQPWPRVLFTVKLLVVCGVLGGSECLKL